MATTTNYGWTTPDDTALVKDGASAIRTLGTSVDTTTKALNPSTTLGDIEYRSSTSNTNTRVGIGSSGQALTVVAGVPSWAASPTSVLTTTGDTLYASAANTLARLGIGTANQVLTVNAGATAPEWKTASTGSTTWTLRKFINTSESAYASIAYNGSNLYVAAGGAGVLATSTDGITWTDRTSGFGANNIRTVAYGNGLFVAVGDQGTITTSTDGITWTARTANMSTNRIWSVTYANSLWVAVGLGGGATNTGGIIYSSDGLTWTRKSQSLTVGTTYYDVIWNGTNWVVTANAATNNMLYASTPSGTWTAIAFVSGAGDLGKIIYDGTRTIVAYSTDWYYTTSATMASPSKYFGINSTAYYPQRTAYYNSKIYMVNGVYWQSFTPATQQGIVSTTPQIAGAPPMGMSGDFSATISAIGVFAIGIFIFSDTGAIWTSF